MQLVQFATSISFIGSTTKQDFFPWSEITILGGFSVNLLVHHYFVRLVKDVVLAWY